MVVVDLFLSYLGVSVRETSSSTSKTYFRGSPLKDASRCVCLLAMSFGVYRRCVRFIGLFPARGDVWSSGAGKSVHLYNLCLPLLAVLLLVNLLQV
ncbi:hypothetical protein N665_1079s0007 [Sinapis alba]|nr:hypothetical protein N665_1079s0007 [Sinapis alba]